jgi:hypothetical protein
LQKVPRNFAKGPHQHQKAAGKGKFFMLVGSLIKKEEKRKKEGENSQKYNKITRSTLAAISVVGRPIHDVLKAPKPRLS